MNFIIKILVLLASVSYFFCETSFANPQSLQNKFKALEKESNGRIGLYAINTGNNQRLQYRANERFPMGCTSKIIGVATILYQSMSNPSLLAQVLNYSEKDLSNWNPITEKHLASGMRVEELCAAAISYSDNAAMNLLVKHMGGLEQMNRFASFLGNASFRQDNGWPEEAYSGGPGNLKDSATPKDMVKSLQKLVFTSALAKSQRELLLAWLKANTTGDFRIRAGVPKGWLVADKTGTGRAYGTTNDIGIIWPGRCAPIILGIYYTSDVEGALKKEALVASLTRLVINEFSQSDSCIEIN